MYLQFILEISLSMIICMIIVLIHVCNRHVDASVWNRIKELNLTTFQCGCTANRHKRTVTPTVTTWLGPR